MIRTRTTFVIGAGASCPYGLPVAGQLHANAAKLNPHSDVYQLILQSSPVGLDGRLSPIPQMSTKPDVFGGYAPEWIGWVRNAAASINVTLDAIDALTLREARKAVAESTVLCFLGFSYNMENLDRLELPTVLNRLQRTPEIFGSAFGFRPGEQEKIRRLFLEKIQLGDGAKNCLDVLRDLPILRE